MSVPLEFLEGVIVLKKKKKNKNLLDKNRCNVLRNGSNRNFSLQKCFDPCFTLLNTSKIFFLYRYSYIVILISLFKIGT